MGALVADNHGAPAELAAFCRPEYARVFGALVAGSSSAHRRPHHYILLFRVMTGDGVAGAAVDQQRLLLRTLRCDLPTTGPETASRRRIGRRRNVACQHDPLADLFMNGVGLGDRG